MLRLALAFMVLATPAWGQDYELEITFYLQPDATGQNTQNKSIQLEDGALTIEESGIERNRYIEREATEAEIALITDLIRDRFAAVEFRGAERVRPPYIEVQFEFDGNTLSVEVEEVYTTGNLPSAYLALQRIFFEEPFE